eukprot:10488184-Lingulodinium_polyedra.AAC.1
MMERGYKRTCKHTRADLRGHAVRTAFQNCNAARFPRARATRTPPYNDARVENAHVADKQKQLHNDRMRFQRAATQRQNAAR